MTEAPIPRLVDLHDASDISTLVDRLLGDGVRAIGIAVAGNSPVQDVRATTTAADPEFDRILLAPESAEAPATDTAAVVYSTDRGNIEALRPLFLDPAPPYCVFADAHLELARLGAVGISPPRFGCIRTAATLLAEGADGRRDDRPVEEVARTELDVALPPLETPAATAARAALLIPLMRACTPKLRRLGLARIYELECRLLPAVIDLEAAGMPVDGAAFERIAAAWVEQRDSCTDESLRTRLDKLISTYRYWVRDFADYDGRIRCQLHPLAAESGRFSCSQPNLQQVPSQHTAPGLRACFRPQADRSFVIADYSQIELRVAAHLAPCPALRSVFQRGEDPHRATAATLTRKPAADVTEHERKLAKAINFGFLFGMGARRFLDYAQTSFGLELELAQAEQARAAFFSTFPGISAWHRRIGALGRQGEREDVVVRTVMGRRKRFLAGEFSYTTALNIPVQGTAAEGFKAALIELRPALEELGGIGVLCVHDEYIAEVPREQADEARTRVIEIMERCMAQLVDSVPIVVEAHVAPHWGKQA